MTRGPIASPSPVAPDELSVAVIGMTCASCVNRIERFLRQADGVTEATVNLASERAQVQYDPTRINRDGITRAIEAAGYDVVPEATGESVDDPSVVARRREQRTLLRDGLIASSIGLAMMALGFIPGGIGLSMEQLNLLLLIPATIVQFGLGGRFLTRAARGLAHGELTMDTLVAMGTGSAWAYSTFLTLAPAAAVAAGLPLETYFDSASVIIGFVLLGRWLEARAKSQAADAVTALLRLQPAVAMVRRNGELQESPIATVGVGDEIVVRPGERVAADGEVIEGSSAVEESMLTGESMPVPKTPGERVTAGTLNRQGSLVVRVDRVGPDSTLAQVARLVDRAQGAKAPIQRLVDRVVTWFVPAVAVTAAVTFSAWLVLGPEPSLPLALSSAVAVLIIACPCAMGLATPTAIMVGTGRGAAAGILIRDGAALEIAEHVDVVVLDKTGTLTRGRPEVVLVVTRDRDETELVRMAAAVEALSEHPLAAAIVRRAGSVAPRPESTVTDFGSEPGGGVSARVDGQSVRIGSEAWLLADGIDTSPLAAAAAEAGRRGESAVWVAIDGMVVGLITVADQVRPDAAASIRRFHDLGLETWLLSGDRGAVAGAVGAQVGIAPERIVSDVAPGDKAAAVANLQGAGHRVVMVGDGVNDAPALAQADLGVAMGTGTDVAAAASAVTLIGGQLRAAPTAIALSRATMHIIRQNLVWAFGYNVLLIPVAAGILYPLTGWTLNPALAAAAMALSSVSVVTNSLRLRRFPVTHAMET
jgi:Cu+-exporting ATPase